MIGRPNRPARRIPAFLALAAFAVARGSSAQEAAKPRIGEIRIQALDVFSPEEAAKGWVYRTAIGM